LRKYYEQEGYSMYEKLFTPVKIGSLTIKNRFAMAPMGPLGLSDSEGGFNQRGIDYYVERAKGGTGLIITGVTFSDCEVEKPSMPNCPNSTYNPVHFIRTGREMTERVHAYGSKIFLMMSGGFGRVTIPTNLGEFPPVAPSEIPHRWLDKTCRALTVEEIHSIVKSFGVWRFMRYTRGICWISSPSPCSICARTSMAVHWRTGCGLREKWWRRSSPAADRISRWRFVSA